MKICYVTYGRGGIASYALSLGKAMVERGHEVHILSYDEPEIAAQAETSGIIYHHEHCGWTMQRILNNAWRVDRLSNYPFDNALRARLATNAVQQLHHKYVFDIIEAPEARAMLRTLLCNGLPILVRMHGPTELTSPLNHPKLLKRISIREKDFAEKTKVITACSSALADWAIKHWHLNKRIHIVHNPIEVSFFSPAQKDERQPNRVLFVGRLESLKGFDVFVKALNQIAITKMQIEVLVIGDDTQGSPDGDSYVEWARRQLYHQSVKFTYMGSLDRSLLPSLYQSAAVTVIPSQWESFPYSALESMACGTPCIASNIGGLPEAIGDCGILISPGDPAALAHNIKMLLGDKAHCLELGHRARARMVDLFSPATIAGQMESVYSCYLQGESN